GAMSELEIQMLRFKHKEDNDPEKLVWGSHGLVLQPGDLVGWRLTNGSRFTLDISVLFIDSAYGIAAVFPRPGSGASGDNRLLRGQSFTVGPVRVNPKTLGLEHLAVIGLRGEGQPVD